MAKPLESIKYLLLAALAAGPNHGTAIRRQLTGDTLGAYVRDSSLYTTLKTLLRDGYIEELPAESAQQRVYQLNQKGWRMLRMEAEMHYRVAELIQTRVRR